METKTKSRTYMMAMVAVMTAITCVLAPMSIAIGAVPITLTNLVVYFSLYLLGWKRGSLSVLVYILIGMMGLPVFSGFSGGLGKLAGPTGGYILGFLVIALVSGWVIDHTRSRVLQLGGMIVGTALCYALGTAWFCFVTQSTLQAALWTCVIPFIPFDLGKMVAAMVVGPVLRERLVQAGLLEQVSVASRSEL